MFVFKPALVTMDKSFILSQIVHLHSNLQLYKSNDSIHITTSSSSTSTATVAYMPHEEQQIYEELLMMLNKQELPPLSNYIVEGSGARGDEDCSWWTSFN